MRGSNTYKRTRPISFPKPVATFEHTAINFTDPSSKRNSSKLYQKPPSYISREISAEEVYDTRADRSMNLNDRSMNLNERLQNIAEEPSEKNLQELAGRVRAYSIDRESPTSEQPAPIRNIFNSEQLDATKFQEQTKGPVYNGGKIIRHSIVGSLELFEKYQRKKQKQLPGKQQDTESSFMTVNESSISVSRQPNRPTLSILREHPRATSAGLKRTGGAKKKEADIPKEQVLAEIDSIKSRQNDFYQRIDKMAQGMKKSDMLFFTKEERCLKRFQNVEEHWNKVFEHASSKLGRSPLQSVMLRAYEYREKKEKAEMFDLLKNDEERFGTNLWYRTLRQTPREREHSTSVVRDDRTGLTKKSGL